MSQALCQAFLLNFEMTHRGKLWGSSYFRRDNFSIRDFGQNRLVGLLVDWLIGWLIMLIR